ncbi:hypothetical protein [Streptomyces celluloflavus]|uniref:hypothetical protein n=1 Tax=Streptomyces celluloflavus TaxID=58344 RepID=UPI0036779CE0
MSATVRVTTLDNGRVALISPYNADVPPAAKKIGGRWNPVLKAWEFDGRDEQRVRDLAREVYGTDGSPEAEADTVTIRWDIGGFDDNELFYAGRRILRRPSRDEDVQLSPGVVLVAGGFPGRGGSVRYPRIAAEYGTVLEIRDLPRAAVDADAPGVTIVDATVDIEALTAERARLMARLTEIEATLSAHGHPDPA